MHEKSKHSTKKKYASEDKRIYRIYKAMKSRCFNPNVSCYKYYGGRGITICDEWMGENGGINFIAWARKNGYDDDLTIDRIDFNKDYSPENCRWATWDEQHRNTSHMKNVVVDGELYTTREISEKFGVPMRTVQNRIRLGWSGKRIIESYNHNFLKESNVPLGVDRRLGGGSR